MQQFDAAIRPVMILNFSKPPFADDPETRAAFVAAMDLPGAAEQVYGDAGEPATSVVPPILTPPEDNPLPDPGPAREAPVSPGR